MKSLPAQVKAYKRTDIFTEKTVPAGLLKDHRTLKNVWAKINVLEGRLTYVIEEPSREERMLSATCAGIVEPQVTHFIIPHEGARFYVEFYK